MKTQPRPSAGAFTLIELLVVIAIIAILSGISMPVYRNMKEKAYMMTHVANVKNITIHTLRWSADNSQTLPSAQYPGGHKDTDKAIPEEWDFTGTGTGLWLDGIVYYAAIVEAANVRAAESKGTDDEKYFKEIKGADGENGNHLKDTIFYSTQSFKKNPLEEDNHRHSYAMNKNIQFDFLYAKSSDPYLTNKNLARIPHRPSALLYIENEETNIIDNTDVEAILETGKKRWQSRKVISSYLDGSARTLSKNDIPVGDIDQDREASRFWRGVDPDNFTGEE